MWGIRIAALWALAAAVLSAPASGWAQTPANAPPPVEAYLGDPAFALPKISPSGDYLAFVRSDGLVDELAVMTLSTKAIKTIFRTKPANAQIKAQDGRQRVVYVAWKSDERLLVSIEVPGVHGAAQTIVDAEDVHLSFLRDGSQPLALNAARTGGGVQIERSHILDPLMNDPEHVLIREGRSVLKVDLRTNERVQIERGGPLVLGYGVDHDGNLVLRQREAGSTYFPYLAVDARAPGETAWTQVWEFHEQDYKALNRYDVLGAGSKPGEFYVVDLHPTDGDTTAIMAFDLKTKTAGRLVWRHPRYDVSGAVTDRYTGEFKAGCYVDDVENCQFVDPADEREAQGLFKYFGSRHSLDWVSWSRKANRGVLFVRGTDEVGSYYLYDGAAHRLEPLSSAWPKRQALMTAKVRRLDLHARDGLELRAYVTRPPGEGPKPLIVMPHGGPEIREDMSIDLWAQFFADRGYEVLQPNFRGSAGFGRKFAEAGYGQWGKAMQTDIADAVAALVATGEIDPRRICVVGASYGGYAALMASIQQPGVYRCVASIAGVTDLDELLRSDREGWGEDSDVYKYELKAIGDPRRDAASLRERSPTQQAAHIDTPVLLIQGTDDYIVPVAQGRAMNAALTRAGKTVRYVEMKDMGHSGWTDRQHAQVLRELDAFLAKYLGAAPTAAASAPPHAP